MNLRSSNANLIIVKEKTTKELFLYYLEFFMYLTIFKIGRSVRIFIIFIISIIINTLFRRLQIFIIDVSMVD